MPVRGRLAVVGAGLMGGGIAQVAAQAGYDVALRDVSEEAAARGTSAIEASLQRAVDKGSLTADDARAARQRVTTTTDLAEAVESADVVVEAVYEHLELKQEVFRELDRVAPEGALLATNTSAIPITRIAAVTRRPEQVVGTHFFSPVPRMRLCEVVRGLRTSEAALERARAFAEDVGKTVVVVQRDVAGFVTTRLISALVVEAVRLVESGVASVQDVDTACQLGFGHAMGPLATTDLTGVDVLRAASENVWAETRDPKFAPPELLARMVAAGHLGRKSGQGFYTYGT